MSRTSTKSKIEQLKSWLDGRKTTTKTTTSNRTKSRSDYYRKQGFNG